ncbi:MAG: alpha/beta hydrolase [Turicibacter sp.]|nr:alpha/beta hydrolase [Turicibacter sp.]
MDKKKAALKAGLVLNALFWVVTFIFGRKMYSVTYGKKPRHGRKGLEGHYQTEGILDRLAEFKHQKFMIENSHNGYHIETLHLKANTPSENVMVIVHGITSNYYDLLPVAYKYLEEGTNVLMYNQRQTGNTGGDNYTFGYFERFDMEEVATVAKRLYPHGWVGVHGFSMGASTAAMHSELNETQKKVDFYILDGPYHTMEGTLDLAFNQRKYPSIWQNYLKWAGNLAGRTFARVKFGDVLPLEAVSKTTVPVLIIHGTEDETCPYVGAKFLFSNIRHPKKELKVFPGLGHCVAHEENPNDYFSTIGEFINKFVA